MIGAIASGRVEQVAPVDTAGVARSVIHRILYGKYRFRAVFVGYQVKPLEVGKQAVAVDFVDKRHHLIEKRFVDIDYGMSLRVLLVSLIELHFGGVGQRNVSVDAANFGLTLGERLGCFEKLVGDALQMLVA